MHEKTKHSWGNTANAAVYIIDPGVFTMGDFLCNPPSDFSMEVIPKLLEGLLLGQTRGITRTSEHLKPIRRSTVLKPN